MFLILGVDLVVFDFGTIFPELADTPDTIKPSVLPRDPISSLPEAFRFEAKSAPKYEHLPKSLFLRIFPPCGTLDLSDLVSKIKIKNC